MAALFGSGNRLILTLSETAAAAEGFTRMHCKPPSPDCRSTGRMVSNPSRKS
jgi:hypothetical protein